MSSKLTPGRSLDQIGRDLVGIRTLVRVQKKELGGITPRTARRARALLAEAEAICSIEFAMDSRTVIEKNPRHHLQGRQERSMNTRSYPRSSTQAFPRHCDYACAVESRYRSSLADWLLAVALGLGGAMLLVWGLAK